MDSNRTSGAAKETLGQFQRAAGEMTGDNATKAKGAVREAEGVIEGAIGQAKDAARDFAGQAFDAGADFAERGSAAIADRVQERPGSSLLLAGVIGFALGVILTKGSQPPRPRYVWDRYR